MSPKPPVALLITPVLPLPTGSGRALRAWDWLCSLARDHQVHVLLASAPEQGCAVPTDYPAVAVWNLADELIPVPRAQRLIGMALPFLVLFSRRFLADWQHLPGNAHVLKQLADRLQNESVVKLLVFRMGSGGAAFSIMKMWPNALADLDMDDIESRTRFSVSGSLLRMGRTWEALYGVLVAAQYFLIERFKVGNYQCAWLASAADCKVFVTNLANHVACRPNRIPNVSKSVNQGRPETLRLLFVGTLNYPPNEEAILFLLHKVLPLLRARSFKWQLDIVGHHATERLKQLIESCCGANLIEDAIDLGPIYGATDVALVPIRAGGGTKLKTLEAFAYSTPVVSTSHGVRGLGAIAGTHYVQAEQPSQFAQAIADLAQDRSLGCRLGQAGNALWQKAFKAA